MLRTKNDYMNLNQRGLCYIKKLCTVIITTRLYKLTSLGKPKYNVNVYFSKTQW